MRYGGVIAALLLFAALPAAAQDFGGVAPRQPAAPAGAAAPQPPAAAAAPAPAQNVELVAHLKGLTLEPSLARIVQGGAPTPGLVIDVPFADDPDLRDILATFIGRPLWSADLPRISKIVTDFYRAHNRPVVSVSFPEQDISTGVVQAVVGESRTGRIKFKGNYYFGKGLLASELDLHRGDPIDFGVLSAGLNVLNRNPFRTVNVVLQKSSAPGTTDLAFTVDERFPLRLYAAFDNTGVAITGRDRYSAGFNWGNVLDLDQQLSYQFITSPDLWRRRDRGAGLSDAPRFTGHSASYTAPLPWGDLLNLFGSYVTQVPDLGPDFGQTGHSFQLGLRYQMPLWGSARFTQQLQFGFDHKRADNNLAFGGTAIFASATDTDQFALIYDGTLDDTLGQTGVENTLVYSPGDFSHGNSTAVFQASGVTGAHANYVYDNLRLTRLLFLPLHFSLMTRLDGQLASTELLPGEQIGAGGIDSVRGYEERSASGSDGYLASVELHGPTIAPLHDLGLRAIDRLQPLVFWDYGHVSFKNAQASGPKAAGLQSAGVGVRYTIGRYLDVRFDYGWQLEKVPVAGAVLGNLATVSVTFGT
ncbi:MAG TPA: ShlB/FhaC/HecB family hemolysin secretion/activation protein [Rhizomicrobium sp.]|nr:ShlB/FhaC/HecB family hemolysin secretion/activation protein [Rhizomicrobium sp.]